MWNSELEIRNAKIESVSLGYEDHGILTAFVHLKYDGGGQVFGGYALDRPVKVEGKFSHGEGTAYGMEFIVRILRAVGVQAWEKLPGTPVRVRATHTKVHAIGHFLEDRWFTPETDLAMLAAREEARDD